MKQKNNFVLLEFEIWTLGTTFINENNQGPKLLKKNQWQKS